MDAAEKLLGDEPAPVYAAMFLAYRTSHHLLAGDLVRADQSATEMLALSELGVNPTLWYGPALVTIRGHQDRLAELVPLLEAGVDEPTFGESYRTALAAAYAFTGRLEAARAVVDGFARDGFRGVRRNVLWLTDMAALAEATERIGDADAAGAIADLLRPFAGRIAAIPATVVSTVDLVLAQMALVAGDAEAAERAATDAVVASRGRRTSVFLGRELVRLAVARRRLGRSHDEVSDLVGEALAISDRTGAALIRTEARLYRLSTG
jgi:hypothetical protein